MSAPTATRPAPRADPAPGRGRAPWAGVLATDLRRSGSGHLALLVAVVGAAVLATQLLPSARWAPTFAGALRWIDNTHYFFGPLVAALAAWVGGREGRRGIGELLAATPRPAWRRVHLTWVAVAAGALAGVLAQAALVVAAGLPSTSYWGGRWWQTLVVLLLGVLVHAAAGFAAGRALPGRLVAPAVGVASFVAVSAVGGDPVLRRMWPVGGLFLNDGDQLRAPVLALLVVWLGGLAAAAVLAAVGPRRLLAVLALAAAAAAAVPLATTAGSSTDPWTEPDPAATAMVCTEDGGPEVCVQRVHAGLLDEVVPLAREVLTAADGLVAWTSAREDVVGGGEPPAAVLPLPALEGQGLAFRDGLAAAEQYRALTVAYQSTSACDVTVVTPEQLAVTGVADAVAAALLSGRTEQLAAVPGAQERFDGLAADRAAARAWMAEYRPAAVGCDLPVLQRLAAA